MAQWARQRAGHGDRNSRSCLPHGRYERLRQIRFDTKTHLFLSKGFPVTPGEDRWMAQADRLIRLHPGSRSRPEPAQAARTGYRQVISGIATHLAGKAGITLSRFWIPRTGCRITAESPHDPGTPSLPFSTHLLKGSKIPSLNPSARRPPQCTSAMNKPWEDLPVLIFK